VPEHAVLKAREVPLCPVEVPSEKLPVRFLFSTSYEKYLAWKRLFAPLWATCNPLN